MSEVEALSESDLRELSTAHEKIRALYTELAMHDDAQVQVAALRKKIAASKERAQGLVNMIDKRITYLYKLWEQYMAKKDDNEIIELARTAVNEPVRINLDEATDSAFFERVNTLKDKVAELMLLDEQAADAHKRAADDSRTLNLATKRLKEVEDRHRALLSNNEAILSESSYAVASLQRAAAAIEKRISSSGINAEEKKDLEGLLKDLRQLLANLPGQDTVNLQSKTPQLEDKISTDPTPGSSATSSTGISGTTVPTNESSSLFTTSSFPSTPAPVSKVQKDPPAAAKETAQSSPCTLIDLHSTEEVFQVKQTEADPKKPKSKSISQKTSTTAI
ncbi:hypothetical protein Y032_0138g2073 [Ancylostoma ceylanicum]|uniref:Uncharacterized protein n=1 Tax=Ancylostoma ceylanicum TaxID=53326 RepID=A0A016T541_9BILA|nr:hypothetical protein Y032_0138g2073 [Ancylostoma ceylanicum]